MTPARGFSLDTKVVGAHPIVNHFLKRLRFDEVLRKHLPRPNPRTQIPLPHVLGFLLRNLVLSRRPLYGLGEWAQVGIPVLMGLEPEHLTLLNDDRVGRALDRLFDADRQALLTDLVVTMVREFDLALDELHNDSTTLTLQGQYKQATGKSIRGKPTLRAALGFNKDYRPDLKQLVWILTVSADGSVPVHFKVADGNTEDSTTHIETWMALQRLVGSANFLYVSDCKLCTRENLKYIHAQGGRFVTVLPRTWKEDSLFKDWIQTHTPAWEEIARKPHPRVQDGPPDIFVAVASPFVDPDGFRVVWYKSSHKMLRDAETRGSLLEEAIKALDAMKAKLERPRSRWHTRASVVQAVDAILASTGAARWLECQVTSVEKPIFRQEKRGRPGDNTRWRRRFKTSFELTWTLRQEQIAYDALCDGLFPLITNENISSLEILDVYKSRQPLVERQHHILKTLQATVPIYLKSISRIEALLFLAFVALLVNALLEREVRWAMERRGIKKLPLYPEERACKAPSAERILEVFGPVQRALLHNKRGVLIQRFEPELNPLHQRLLGLLGVPIAAFDNR